MCFRARLKIREGGEGFWLAHLMCEIYPPNLRFPTQKLFSNTDRIQRTLCEGCFLCCSTAYPCRFSTAGSNECSPNCCGKKIDAFEHSHCQVAACDFRFLLDTFFGPTTCWFGLDVVYRVYLFSPRLRIHMYFWSIVMFEVLYIWAYTES